MTPAVKVENVSMRFVIQHNRPRSFQDALVNLVHQRSGSTEEFWALKDVSFEIQPGETLGIIGQNGSGKSTILKLITKILEPTSGRVMVNGKVSALIELGAGFHPDLSGRENIYLNGSIMGFGRKEMDRRFDEIVAFAELEKFIDTPVKHYSSGMYARLGFSVAISVDPDILIIDEVLSVGDEAFQRKCINRIRDFRRQGRTIVFVSHGMSTVESLCDRVLWLNQGVVIAEGTPNHTIPGYMNDIRCHDESNMTDVIDMGLELTGTLSSSFASQLRISILKPDGAQGHSIVSNDQVFLQITYKGVAISDVLELTVEIRRDDGVLAWSTTTTPSRRINGRDTKCEMSWTILIPSLSLQPGRFLLSAQLRKVVSDGHAPGIVSNHYSIEVLPICPASDVCEHGIAYLQYQWLSDANDKENFEITPPLETSKT